MIYTAMQNVEIDESFYKIQNQQFPRVSTIISEAGLYKLEGPSARIEYARDRGSKAHKACALFDLGILDWSSVDPAILPYVKAWQLFCVRTGFKPMSVEMLVMSLTYQYAGTMDVLGHFDGQLAIVDRKCTAVMPKSAGCQLDAYRLAYNEGLDKKNMVRQIMGVQLCKDGTFKRYPYESAVYHLTFLSAINIYNFNNRSRL